MPTPEPSNPPTQPLNAETARAVAAVYDLYDPPLWLVTAAESAEPGSRRGGCIATFVARASIVRELPRMVAGLARHHHTWRMIEASGRFTVHLLPGDGLDLVLRFGLTTGHDTDKFAGLPDRRTPLGSPLIDNALSWLDCRVETSMSSGDRSIYLAEVTGGGVLAPEAEPPMTVGRLMDMAPRDKADELDRLYARDGRIDADAILGWRRQR